GHTRLVSDWSSDVCSSDLGDILLANEPPRGLSARNVIQGRIVSLAREGPTVVARVDAGATFVVHLTPAAVETLGLETHRLVWLKIGRASGRERVEVEGVRT